MDDASIQAAYTSRARRAGARGRCPSPEALQDLAGRAVHGDDAAPLFDHVLGCRPCTEEYELLRAVHHTQPRARPASVRWMPFALAASAALMLGIGSVWITRRAPDATMRGSSSEVQILGVATTVRRGDSLRLVWRPVDGATAYRVELLDPAGAVLGSTLTGDTVVSLPPQTIPATVAAFDWIVMASRGDGNQRRSALLRVQVTPDGR